MLLFSFSHLWTFISWGMRLLMQLGVLLGLLRMVLGSLEASNFQRMRLTYGYRARFGGNFSIITSPFYLLRQLATSWSISRLLHVGRPFSFSWRGSRKNDIVNSKYLTIRLLWDCWTDNLHVALEDQFSLRQCEARRPHPYLSESADGRCQPNRRKWKPSLCVSWERYSI